MTFRWLISTSSLPMSNFPTREVTWGSSRSHPSHHNRSFSPNPNRKTLTLRLAFSCSSTFLISGRGYTFPSCRANGATPTHIPPLRSPVTASTSSGRAGLLSPYMEWKSTLTGHCKAASTSAYLSGEVRRGLNTLFFLRTRAFLAGRSFMICATGTPFNWKAQRNILERSTSCRSATAS